jgi:hypothetical protein
MSQLPSPISDVSATDSYMFTPAELTRLAHYRAAVQAGFYSDAVGRLHGSCGQQSLRASTGAFTFAELARLVAYSGAVAAGLYSDFPAQGGRADLP